MTITDPAVSAHADATIGLFEITDHITIDSTQGAHTVEMWCPVIGDGAFQRVLDVEVTSEDPYDLTREPEFGNLMLYSRLRLATAASWSIRYVVERRAIGHAPDPARARPLATAQLFSRALIPEAHVDVDERTRTLAQDVVGPETNPLEQARRIYDYVTGAMDYDATKQSFLGSTEHALTCSVGNCNDIHALFVAVPIGRHPRTICARSGLGATAARCAGLRGVRLPLLGGILRRWAGLATGGRLLCDEVRHPRPVREPAGQPHRVVDRPRHPARPTTAGGPEPVLRRPLRRD